jgi:GDPmannose 4,6-dehydratase
MQWLMLQQEEPEDFVIATGIQFTVRQFIEWSASELGIKLHFEGTGLDEIAVIASISEAQTPNLKVGDIVVRIDPRYFRPTEVESLLGDPTKAMKKLGWFPEISVQAMCAEMVREDLEQAKKASLLKHHGFSISMSSEQ